jgi:magnesium transporter
MEEKTSQIEAAVAPAELAAQFADHHVADIAEMLNEQPVGVAAATLALLPPERAVEVLDQPELDRGAALVAALPAELAVKLLTAMSADRQADTLRAFEREMRDRVLERLDPDTRASVTQLLAYPENTAGALMTTEYVSALPTWTVAETLDHIRRVERTRETIYAIYIVDPRSRKLLRALSLRRLIVSDPEALVMSVALKRRPVAVSPQTDREDVARLISKYDLLAAPVLDRAGRMLGIVTVDDVIDAIVAEGTEDVQKFGGTEALDRPYMEIGFGMMVRKRAGWLCVLFLSEMLTATAMQHFDSELQKAIVLALFIPLIMSSGGNSGSQATSLLIRALALGEVRLADWWRVGVRELPMGVTLGAILGVIALVRIAVWQLAGLYDYGPQWELVAITVASALVGIVTFGSVAGSLLPFVLKRAGFDPASASAPFIATLVDVSGLVIYFTIASLILGGRLL